MSAKNITRQDQKPDPAISARVWNLVVDGSSTTTAALETVPVTIQATGISNATQVVNLSVRRSGGLCSLILPVFTIASANQNSSGILTISALPVGYRPLVAPLNFPLEGFRIPSTGARSQVNIAIDNNSGVITITLDSTGALFTGGATGNVMGSGVATCFTYPC